MSDIPTKVSAAVRRRNPHLYGAGRPDPVIAPMPDSKAPRRLRQDQGPLMNKLETRLMAYLKMLHPGVAIHPQGWRVRLANGLWFKVDLVGVVDGRWTAWEAKGPRAFRGGFENLKMAASVWPEVRWVLMWEQDGQWQSQDIRP